MMIPTGLPAPATPTAPEQREAKMRQRAQDLEATFLTEMLAHAGVGEAQGAMTGGIGEEQFASFLRREQANAIAQHGGLGLAEAIFEAMKGAESHGN